MTPPLQSPDVSRDLALSLSRCRNRCPAGQRLVGERLAACVDILPGVRSVDRWQDTIRRGDNVQLLIETTRHRLDAPGSLVRASRRCGPPGRVSVEGNAGLPGDLQWLVAHTWA